MTISPKDVSSKLLTGIVPLLMVLAAVLAILWWYNSPFYVPAKRLPGSDRPPAYTKAKQKPRKPFTAFATLKMGIGKAPFGFTDNWLHFRGDDFTNIYSNSHTLLARTWPPQGPKVLWQAKMGEGYASPAVIDGRLYVIDYDHATAQSVIRCMSLADGRDIWRFAFPEKVKRNHGMSRTIPAVTAKYVVAISPKCKVVCLHAQTGKLLWGIDLVRQFGTKVPLWYAGQCPFIDNGKVIIAPGGSCLMMAVDCATGKVVWETPNPQKLQMTHSSILPLTWQQQRMYVYCASKAVVGINPANGRLLWQNNSWKISIANVPSPVYTGQGRIFLSGGYNSGSMMIQLKKSTSAITTQTLFRLKPSVFGSAQQTPIFYKGFIYGVRPDGQMVCLNPDGTIIWKSTPACKFGLGPYMIANGLIYALDDHGLLRLIEATPTGYHQLAQAQILHGHDSWGPLVLINGRLILRDLTTMICVDVAQ